MESSTPSRDTAWAMSEENVDVTRRAVPLLVGAGLSSPGYYFVDERDEARCCCWAGAAPIED